MLNRHVALPSAGVAAASTVCDDGAGPYPPSSTLRQHLRWTNTCSVLRHYSILLSGYMHTHLTTAHVGSSAAKIWRVAVAYAPTGRSVSAHVGASGLGTVQGSRTEANRQEKELWAKCLPALPQPTPMRVCVRPSVRAVRRCSALSRNPASTRA